MLVLLCTTKVAILEHGLKNENDPKSEDDLKIEDEHKNEAGTKNEDEPKMKMNPKMKMTSKEHAQKCRRLLRSKKNLKINIHTAPPLRPLSY